MALVNCTECNTEMSLAAGACPKCGHPNASVAAPRKKSHAGGWLAVGAIVLASFTPAILAPLLILAAFAFTAKEFGSGSKVFGMVTLCMALLSGWAVLEHFGQVSGKLGITNASEVTSRAEEKYRNVSLSVPADWRSTLQAKCAEEWPSDYRMKEHCRKTQTEAVRTLDGGALPGVDQAAFRIIRGKCAEEWPRDFRMRAHCEKTQSDGYRALQTSSVAESARNSCAQRWPDDFRMRRHCETR